MPEATVQANHRAVDSAVQPCPLKHYFSVELKPSDWASAKPAWWPAEKRPPYAGVKARITLGGVVPQQALNSRSRCRVEGIPGGNASVDFAAAFYDDVKDALDNGRNLSA